MATREEIYRQALERIVEAVQGAAGCEVCGEAAPDHDPTCPAGIAAEALAFGPMGAR